MPHDVSSPPPALRNLETINPHDMVGTFLSSSPGPQASIPSAALEALGPVGVRALVKQLLDTLTDRSFKAHFLRAIAAHMVKHPIRTAFLVVAAVAGCAATAIGCSLPIVGSGSLAVVVGSCPPSYTYTRAHTCLQLLTGGLSDSLATAWLASAAGSVAATSALAILRNRRMLGKVVVPVALAAAVAIANSPLGAVMAAQGMAAVQEVGRWWSAQTHRPRQSRRPTD